MSELDEVIARVERVLSVCGPEARAHFQASDVATLLATARRVQAMEADSQHYRELSETRAHLLSNALLERASEKSRADQAMARVGELETGAVNSLNLLRNLCYQRSRDAGWHDRPRDDGTFIALIHSEVSECLEGLRKNLMDDHLPHRKMAEVELADTLIRIFDFAGYKGYDLSGAVLEKLAYNSTREDHKREVRVAKGGKAF